MKQWTPEEIWTHYKADTFVETGTFQGKGVQRALDTGYTKVISVEIHFDRYKDCKERFENEIDKSVFLFNGDSIEYLPQMLDIIQGKCCFWLDAHLSGVSRGCPTLEELKIIGAHPNCKGKNHTILIDDIRDFNTPTHENITVDELKSAILSINPQYQMEMIETANVQASSILAATVN
tara:strand:- start:19 stop:552 length:534 start_codon:yes stop_codon:yes gene_type:complete